MTVRADQALAARGLARSRTEAAALIGSGAVLLNGVGLRKPSRKVAETDRLEVSHDAGPRYVSRAAHKLVSALDAFADVPVQGRRALDAGASTGGFTQVLLQRGARRVVAVDVGHGQLAAALREDDRVDVHEGLNVRSMTPEGIGGPADLVVSDLSFISLTLVMDALAGACSPGADLVLMVKPQFEVGRARLPRTGVVSDPEDRRDAVRGVLAAALAAGLSAHGLVRSGLPGQDGNAEFFLHLRRPGTPDSDAGEQASGSGQDGARTDAVDGVEEATRAWLAGRSVDWA